MGSLYVLLVEGDETAKQQSVGQFLSKREHVVIRAGDAQTAAAKAHAEWPDLIVVNASSDLPDAFEICETLDHSDLKIPRLIISDDETRCNLRGTAHLTMPFTPQRLTSRIKKALEGQPGRFLRAGEICVDTLKHAVKYRGRVSHLTPKELDLLTYFIKSAGRDISRTEIMREVWDTEYTGDTRTIEVHIRWLRCKVEEDPKHPKHIITVRRVGYRFEARE